MASLFSRIVAGEIPAHKIAEDDRFLAFLDIFPLTVGHTLVIPKEETDYIFDLTPELLGDLHRFSQRVAVAIRATIPCKRVGVAVAGLEVPHAHIHLIPIHSIADINFSRPKLELSQDQLAETARQIRARMLQG